MADSQTLVEGLRSTLPFETGSYRLISDASGLVIVDEVNGFCTVGAGSLAPREDDPQIATMVKETDRLARTFRSRRLPIFVFLDTHEPGKLEPPYPAHCVRGSGEENIVPQLQWLEDDPDVTLLRKDCVNGFVGAIEPAVARGMHGVYHNKMADWVNAHRLQAIVVVGTCTDIAVMEFVLTILSARSHGLMPTLKDIVVYAPACATCSASPAAGELQELPDAREIPRDLTHHMGLYYMASRGAIIVNHLDGI